MVRLTIDDDLTTPHGLAKAIAAISTPDAIVMSCGAPPGTGGSQWQRLNWHHGNAETRETIKHHRRVFRVLWRHFVQVAEHCLAVGGGIAFERPGGCAYWREREVQSFMKRHKLTEVQYDGCMAMPRCRSSSSAKAAASAAAARQRARFGPQGEGQRKSGDSPSGAVCLRRGVSHRNSSLAIAAAAASAARCLSNCIGAVRHTVQGSSGRVGCLALGACCFGSSLEVPAPPLAPHF